jgi:phosphatidylserine decarboxylase
MSDRLRVLPQYLLPKQALTQVMGRLAGLRGGPLTTAAVRAFVRRYGVDMAEAAQPDPVAYPSFNDFFTRPLRAGVRPLAPSGLVCPVDGAISQCGAIDGDLLVQAKGHAYTTRALLGGDDVLAARFRDGCFATLYLSPKDYHRIHMPCAGRLRRMVHVPGDLFSVNPLTARAVPGLFARNERVVCVFEGEGSPDGVRGPWALVLVGATIVGSMATTWHGVVNPPRPGVLRHWDYADQAVRLERGAEMGRFLLGSTVVLLFGADAGGGGPPAFEPGWAPGAPVRVGQAMARVP